MRLGRYLSQTGLGTFYPILEGKTRPRKDQGNTCSADSSMSPISAVSAKFSLHESKQFHTGSVRYATSSPIGLAIQAYQTNEIHSEFENSNTEARVDWLSKDGGRVSIYTPRNVAWIRFCMGLFSRLIGCKLLLFLTTIDIIFRHCCNDIYPFTLVY